MEEYRDGSFGDIQGVHEKFKELLGMDEEKLATVKAVHIGTRA